MYSVLHGKEVLRYMIPRTHLTEQSELHNLSNLRMKSVNIYIIEHCSPSKEFNSPSSMARGSFKGCVFYVIFDALHYFGAPDSESTVSTPVLLAGALVGTPLFKQLVPLQTNQVRYLLCLYCE